FQSLDQGFHAAVGDVHAQHAAVYLPQCGVVAGRLGGDETAEGVVGLRNRDVVGGAVHQLDEHPGVGPALVELSRGVQEAGPVAESGGALVAFGHDSTDAGGSRLDVGVGRQIRLQGHVVTGTHVAEEPL